MKTSSVEFISRSPTPLPMKVNIDGLCCSGKSLSPGSGNEGKEKLFEQTSRTLERKILMRSTKDQLVKKTFSSGLDEKRTAADSVQSGWPIVAAKTKSSRAAQ
ncbi:hypothetical protein TNCV_2652511 [Trichonephila clavipes]|nr:hypothetical protein TNCV_2652511 [Trichonephila clavipes]